MMKLPGRHAAVLFLSFVAISTGFSQSNAFRFERQVLPGGPGPNRIAPDVALLSGAAFSDLRDLRFHDASGKEMPYLLVPPVSNSQPRWMTGKLLPVASTPDSSGFEVDFGSASRIDRFLLWGIPAPYLKRFRLEGSGDRSRWTVLIAEGTLFDLPDEKLRLTEVEFDPGEYRYLRVTWDDRKSGRVPEPQSAAVRLVEPRTASPSLRATAEFRRVGAAPGRSRFQARLPGAHLPIVAVELSVGETRLLRSAQVTESLLAGSEVEQKTLGSVTIRRVSQDDVVASELSIPISRPNGREIEIVVEDENNPPLDLRQVTLVFASQPWIYLESPRGEALQARYGDSTLSAPRYDLEAMRQYIGRTGLKEARWGESREVTPSPSPGDVGIDPGAGGTIDLKSFRYSRQIPESARGLTTLAVDAAVLARSRSNLEDLRIADESGRQIPYLLERRQDPLSLAVPLTPESATASRQSRYRIDLPFETLPAGRLVLTTSERVFQRAVSLEAPEAKRTVEKYRSRSRSPGFASTQWRHDDPDSPAPPLSLDVPAALVAPSITLTVDEGDNRPLPLTGARLELPAYHLRFFYPDKGKLTLLYGNDKLPAPLYDLQLLVPRLVGVASREIAFDAVDAPGAVPAADAQTSVFWIVLVGAICVILLLLARLLRSEAAQS